MIIGIRILIVILGALAGFSIADLYINTFEVVGTDEPSLFIAVQFFGIMAGGGLGYVIGGIVGRAAKDVLDWLEQQLKHIPGIDILIGVAGLVIGLIIAFFLSFGLGLVPRLGPYLAILSFVIFGYLGMFIAFRKKEDICHFFRLSEWKGGDGGPTGLNPKVIDTSTIIDGRIIDIYRTGFIEGTLIIPQFVLDELQNIADSNDSLRRNRGRRGLDILNTLQREEHGRIDISPKDFSKISGVDSKLVQLAKDMKGTLVTVDYNLNKVARLQGVDVLNVNELANALKTIVLPGEEMKVHVVREGKEAGQGVAYLEDGTMIVVEEGQKFIGKDIDCEVTSVLQTPAGRMIFVKKKS